MIGDQDALAYDKSMTRDEWEDGRENWIGHLGKIILINILVSNDISS